MLFEIATMLGSKEGRSNHIYFARFIMLCINHICKNVELERPRDTLDCWIQNKRELRDLIRITLHFEKVLIYPPFVQVFISNLSFHTQANIALPSTIMEGGEKRPKPFPPSRKIYQESNQV